MPKLTPKLGRRVLRAVDPNARLRVATRGLGSAEANPAGDKAGREVGNVDRAARGRLQAERGADRRWTLDARHPAAEVTGLRARTTLYLLGPRSIRSPWRSPGSRATGAPPSGSRSWGGAAERDRA